MTSRACRHGKSEIQAGGPSEQRSGPYRWRNREPRDGLKESRGETREDVGREDGDVEGKV